MRADQMRAIKTAIKDLKHERSFVAQLKKDIIKRHADKIKEYNVNDYFEARLILQLEYEKGKLIYKLYQDFGQDIMIHIIYLDGSQCIVSGDEIVSGVNPPLQHIAYACYSDAYTQYDTEIGCLDELFQHGEKAEEMNSYFSMIEIKFNTVWGKAHK